MGIVQNKWHSSQRTSHVIPLALEPELDPEEPVGECEQEQKEDDECPKRTETREVDAGLAEEEGTGEQDQQEKRECEAQQKGLALRAALLRGPKGGGFREFGGA